ncbi:cobalamin B12-binding domain-containing protein [Amycolatopsis minnesotensis]|uniref:B12-binding domain-containing protein n=1 Tax=Amycolatopsis minnesotensis TaxID=337894 RepID=A0ABN2RKJ8_9PSEU
MTQSPVQRPSVLLSSVSSDSHTWNLVYLALLLEENGYAVTNLGSCVPDDLLIASARELAPAAIVISSVNGHGRIDGARVIRKIRAAPDIASLPVVIGGKLGIGAAGEEQTQDLLDAGFTLVFGDADAHELSTALAGLVGVPAQRDPGVAA